MDEPVKVVLAGSFHAFKNHCRERGWSPRERGIVFASNPDRLRGLKDVEVYICETWYQRDWELRQEIWATLRMVGVLREEFLC